MKQSDMNHLRRLLGWIRCEIGLPPAEQQRTMISIAEKLGECGIDADAKARLVEGYRRAEAVPVYVRDAVNALEKSLPAPGRGPGAEVPRATAETRVSIGFDPGSAAGREPVKSVDSCGASGAAYWVGIDLSEDGIATVRDAALEEAAGLVGGQSWSYARSDVSELIAGHIRALKSLSVQPGAQAKECNCATCRPHSVEMRMILCELCGDKRCPHAADHRNVCTGTHLDRQGAGSAYGHLKQRAAALGNRDWKWWDSCSFRRLTFEDGPNRRDGSALHGTVQASDGHPDVSMAPGVREFIEATSPQAIASMCDDLAAKNRALEIVRSELAALVSECERADSQAARELRRTFIYPNVLEGAKRVLAASLQEVQP